MTLEELRLSNAAHKQRSEDRKRRIAYKLSRFERLMAEADEMKARRLARDGDGWSP